MWDWGAAQNVWEMPIVKQTLPFTHLMCTMRKVHPCNVHPSLDHFLGHLHRSRGRPYVNDTSLNVIFVRWCSCWNSDTVICLSVAVRNKTNNEQSIGPIVQMMPVLRDTAGSESMSSKHMCSIKDSAMAACSCWVWMMEEPESLDFDMTGSVSARKVLGRNKGKWERWLILLISPPITRGISVLSWWIHWHCSSELLKIETNSDSSWNEQTMNSVKWEVRKLT